MAKLSDYGIKLDDIDSSEKVKIRGQFFPVDFHMESMEYIADVYDDDYSKFEKDTNDMLKRLDGELTSSKLTANDLKIMRSLIFAMLRTGGLEEDCETVSKLVGVGNDMLEIYSVCMKIFSNNNFQVGDLKKSKKPQDFQRSNKKNQIKNPKK
ncbi:hypothetical protein AB6834_02685 [Carnobacterium divergens]|uniref:hypothetical protein n=1 Tax=Carnobacterium divergens TaxID=2748 RepID=UPI0039BEAEDC